MMSPGEGNNHGKALIKAPAHKTMENRSPVVSVGKTMLDPTVDPDDSIDVRNPDAKRENQKSMRYLRGTISTLKQHHKKNDYRWILATIVESGNRRFWGWHELFFVTFFWLLFFLCTF
jgi:hypothetical protein